MSFTKILCPVDFSAGSQQAVRAAGRIARECDGELVIVHAWYIPPSAYSREAPLPSHVIDRITADSQHALDAVVRQAVANGVTRARGKLLTGLPWAKIVEELESEAYDLCVIGTHGRTGLARILLGSVAEKVIRHAPCSVLAVHPDGEIKPFKHALVPTDFSESAAHALDVAATLVEPTGSVTLMHVIEAPVAYSGEPPVADFGRDLDVRAATALDKELERFRRSSRLPITGCSRLGYPGAQTLAQLDDDRHIDVVVMGTRGHTGIKRALLGSVAEKVVRHARCPVLVARNRAAKESV